VQDLRDYFAGRDADLGGCVLVEMLADLADDDWEADAGAVLVYPRQIVAVTPIDPADYRQED
jgi:hypothetical protein